MKYYKCIDCWRVYTHEQLLDETREACACESRRFKGSSNKILRRLFTDFNYTIKTLIRERLNCGKER